MLEQKAPFKNLLGHALVKAEDGRDMHKSWGNAIWFDDAAEKMGVDVMRWLYASQNPEHNLLFGYSHGDGIRKKLIQLWNSYSFFATYAEVDGFDPSKTNINDADLNIMDKWIISKLHLFIKEANLALNDFSSEKMMKKFELFLDELSNWYIRRSRRRFWKSEDDSDKQAAYAVLYEVLTNTIKILAPVLPFITENMYQNLVKNVDSSMPESIHLCDYPKSEESMINLSLMDKVDALRKIIELGRSARNKASIKIRQPLAELAFSMKDDDIFDFIMDQQQVVMDELNVKKIKRVDDETELIKYNIKPNLPLLGQKYGSELKTIKEKLNIIDENELLNQIRDKNKLKIKLKDEEILLGRDDLLFESQSTEGFTSSGDDNFTVGLTTKLTKNLIQEGIVRDIIRHVQTMRKNANFAVEDRIKVFALLEGQVGEAISSFERLFKNEVLAVDMINESKTGEYSETFQIANQNIKFGIERI